MRKNRQTEGALKAWVLNQLIDQGRIDRATVLASEFSLPTEELRADLALLADEFIGEEIKGPLDSLRRLSRQIQSYGRIFDRTILVCSSAHIVRVLGRAPCVELWEVTSDFRLVIHHGPCLSSSFPPDRKALARVASSRSALLTSLHVDAREAVVEGFRDRFSQSSRRFWASLVNGPASEESLTGLSRFLEQRNLHRASKLRKDAFWADWHQRANSPAKSGGYQ